MSEQIDRDRLWKLVKAQLHIGQLVRGKVAFHVPFGVFVDLRCPFWGLIDIGEFGKDEMFPEDGCEVTSTIVGFTEHNQEIRLSHPIRTPKEDC
jgi:predicted RNA-binding protein with RPS1 domain